MSEGEEGKPSLAETLGGNLTRHLTIFGTGKAPLGPLANTEETTPIQDTTQKNIVSGDPTKEGREPVYYNASGTIFDIGGSSLKVRPLASQKES